MTANPIYAQPPGPPCGTPPCGGNGNGGGPPCFPPPCVPIDQGVLALLAVGAFYGARKIYISDK